MRYTGSCHCGNVRYSVEGELDKVIECNCSHCARKGFLLWFVPREKFTLETPDADIGTYLFNKRVIRHQFCRTCGTEAFAYGEDPKGHAMAAINVRCLEGVDLRALKHVPFDGRSM